MLPDPSELRGAATALDAAADRAGTGLARVSAAWGGLCWHAPVADDVRRELARAEASAAAGCSDLRAGAAHLRVLAAAVEELTTAARRLHDAAERELRAAVPAAPAATPVTGPTAAAALAELPGPQDPSWAERAGAHPVALPARAAAAVRQVPASPRGRVEVDVEGVRRLAALVVAGAGDLAVVSAGAGGRVRGLPLRQLDGYGLAGSRSAVWLEDALGAAGGLAAAGRGWSAAGRRAGLLADLLDAADGSAALLAYPQLGLLLDALAATRARDGVAGPGLRPDELAWLSTVLPGLPGGAAAGDGGSWLGEHWVDIGAFLHDGATAPARTAIEMRAEVTRLAAEARRLLTSARGLAGPAADDARVAGRALLARARTVRSGAEAVERFAGRWRVPSLALRATDAVADVPVLRHLSWAGLVGPGIGVVQDVAHGESLGHTAADLGKGLAVTAAGAALTGVVVAALPVELTVGAGVLVGVAVGIGVQKAVDTALPVVVAGTKRAAVATGRAAGAVGRGARDLAADARPALTAAGSAMGDGVGHAGAALRDAGGALSRGAADAGRQAGEAASSARSALARAGRRLTSLRPRFL